MQRKGVDFATTRTSRVDRFAQMSKVEQVIEQKKREIQARLQKIETPKNESNEQESNTIETTEPLKPTSPPASKEKDIKPKKLTTTGINIFSNDGSFLDQFKQLNKDKLNDFRPTKTTTSEQTSETSEKFEQDKKNNEKSKTSRWSLNRDTNMSSNNDNNSKYSTSRYSDSQTRFEQQLPTKSFNSSHYKQSYQSEMANSQNMSSTQYDSTLISTNYPPPSFTASTNVPHQIQNSLPSVQNETLHQPTPTPSTVPIQLPNIPPPPLNDIPNPKPLDIHNIPPPNQIQDNDIINTDVLKNIPPPNKSIPPPLINSVNVTKSDNSLVSMNVSYPPPIQSTTTLPPTALQTTVPPPTPLISQTSVPPPNPPVITPVIPPAAAQFPLPLPNTNSLSTIPPLMAQPVLPPIGMNICIQPQINLPPPGITTPSIGTSSTIPPLLTQPPPNPQQLTSSIPPMTVPPPNLISSNNNSTEHCLMRCEVCPIGSESYNAMTSVARMVAQFGSSYEDAVRQRSHQDPNMWFLYNVNSAAYQQYQKLVKEFKVEMSSTSNNEYKPEDLYEPDNASATDENDDQQKYDSIKLETRPLTDSDTETYNNDSLSRRKRRRKSRWGGKVESVANILPSVVSENKPAIINVSTQVPPLKTNPTNQGNNSILLTKVTRTDPALIQYAINTFGTTNLSEEDWQKAEDHYKINLLYQDMLRKRQEVERLQKAGKFKYEYDSDEEVDGGGTWEHKLRQQEMEATKLWATELTKKAEGKHHIGDFLPPEELRKFLEQSNAAKEGREPNLSDYKEYKLKSDNIGFKMLQKLGWSEGQGLGAEGSGIVEPINKAPQRDLNQGLGANVAGNINETDDEYDAYRKRMMLAYRFRPNPLNNPRRPYY